MSHRVLVVDDEVDIREVARAALEGTAKWHVRTAASGPEGMELAASDPPEAILLDLMMPGMDGLATLRTLRGDPRTAQVPVLLMTARVMPEDLARYEHVDVQGVVAKPFDPLALAEEIATLLGW